MTRPNLAALFSINLLYGALLAQPETVLSEPPKEEKREFLITPGIGIYPIGYDSINIGDETGQEGKRWFLGVKPSLNLAIPMETSLDRKLDLELGYSMTWREYFNKDTTSRDLDHVVNGNISIPWSEKISTGVPTLFEYFFKSGSDENADNMIYIETEPQVRFQVISALQLKLGYFMYFIDLVDWNVTVDGLNQISDPPSDTDEFRRGNPASDATIFPNYDLGLGGIFSGGPTYPNGGIQTVWINWHAASMGASYTPNQGSTIGLDYKVLFAGFSNVDDVTYLGHYVTPSFSQELPWKGGSASLSNELRVRNYRYAKAVEGEDRAKMDLQNKLQLSFLQSINDYTSLEANFGYTIVGNNSDNFDQLKEHFLFSIGSNFSF